MNVPFIIELVLSCHPHPPPCPRTSKDVVDRVASGHFLWMVGYRDRWLFHHRPSVSHVSGLWQGPHLPEVLNTSTITSPFYRWEIKTQRSEGRALRDDFLLAKAQIVSQGPAHSQAVGLLAAGGCCVALRSLPAHYSEALRQEPHPLIYPIELCAATRQGGECCRELAHKGK